MKYQAFLKIWEENILTIADWYTHGTRLNVQFEYYSVINNEYPDLDPEMLLKAIREIRKEIAENVKLGEWTGLPVPEKFTGTIKSLISLAPNKQCRCCGGDGILMFDVSKVRAENLYFKPGKAQERDFGIACGCKKIVTKKRTNRQTGKTENVLLPVFTDVFISPNAKCFGLKYPCNGCDGGL